MYGLLQDAWWFAAVGHDLSSGDAYTSGPHGEVTQTSTSIVARGDNSAPTVLQWRFVLGTGLEAPYTVTHSDFPAVAAVSAHALGSSAGDVSGTDSLVAWSYTSGGVFARPTCGHLLRFANASSVALPLPAMATGTKGQLPMNTT